MFPLVPSLEEWKCLCLRPQVSFSSTTNPPATFSRGVWRCPASALPQTKAEGAAGEEVRVLAGGPASRALAGA